MSTEPRPTLTKVVKALEHLWVEHEADYMVFLVEGATPQPEIIINVRASFKAKVEYLERAYNEDLTLKAVPHIKITKVAFCTESALADTIKDL